MLLGYGLVSEMFLLRQCFGRREVNIFGHSVIALVTENRILQALYRLMPCFIMQWCELLQGLLQCWDVG